MIDKPDVPVEDDDRPDVDEPPADPPPAGVRHARPAGADATPPMRTTAPSVPDVR